MPWKSKKQMAWGNSAAGRKALGKAKVDEFNEATEQAGISKTLPKRVKHRKKKSRGK